MAMMIATTAAKKTKMPTKEGRNCKYHINMSLEAGHLLLKDLIDFKSSGFNRFLPKTYQTKDFWESRPQFQEVPFGAFLAQADRMAQIAISQMPSKDRKNEESKIKALENGVEVQKENCGEKTSNNLHKT